jgi:hypothetical protein
VRWQVFRRTSKRGLVRVDVSNGDRVKSRVLKAWLRAVGSGDAVRIRIAEGERGDQLFPAEAEAEREAKEAERDANRILREANENERRARRAAEDEVARLKLALERARRAKRWALRRGEPFFPDELGASTCCASTSTLVTCLAASVAATRLVRGSAVTVASGCTRKGHV